MPEPTAPKPKEKGCTLDLLARLCEQCFKEYQPTRKGQRFCRPQCRAAWHRAQITCPYCGRAHDIPRKSQ